MLLMMKTFRRRSIFFSDPETLNIDRSNKSKEKASCSSSSSLIYLHNNNNNNNNNNRDTTKMSKDLVLLCCTQQNRPFNATNLADALQKEGVKKATAQRYLDNLVEEKIIVLKRVGNQNCITRCNRRMFWEKKRCTRWNWR